MRRRPAVAAPSALPLVSKREAWKKSLKLSSLCLVPESPGPATVAFSVSLHQWELLVGKRKKNGESFASASFVLGLMS